MSEVPPPRPAPGFPPGSKLLAKVGEKELELGLFVPGDRLEPLRGAGIRPWEVELVDEGGQPIPRRRRPVGFLAIRWTHWLFDERDTLAGLVEQDPGNRWPSLDEPPWEAPPFIVEAFDLSSLYAKAGLVAGDYLELELLDAAGSRFRARPVKAAGLEPAAVAAWLAEGARAAIAVGEELGGPASPLAFVRGIFERAPELLERPAAAFDDLYRETETLDLRAFWGSAAMWLDKRYVPRLGAWRPAEPRAGADGLESALARCGLGLTRAELAAFAKEALRRCQPAFAGIGRALACLGPLALPEGALRDLEREARALAEEVAASYDPAAEEPRLAAARASIIEVYADYLLWQRRLGARLDDRRPGEPDEGYRVLQIFMWKLTHILGLVEGEPPYADPFLAEAERSLPLLAETARDCMGELWYLRVDDDDKEPCPVPTTFDKAEFEQGD